jgi:hypothetical protein
LKIAAFTFAVIAESSTYSPVPSARGRSTLHVVRGLKPAAMRVDDRTRDRQAHARHLDPDGGRALAGRPAAPRAGLPHGFEAIEHQMVHPADVRPD